MSEVEEQPRIRTRARRPAPREVEPDDGDDRSSAQASGSTSSAPAKRERDEFVYDPKNERVVISAAIAADATKRRTLIRSISADEMLVPGHAAIWRAFRVMVDRGLEFDGEVFRRLVADEGTPVSDDYLVGLEDEAGIPTNLDWHVSTLRWDATKARVLSGSLPDLVRSMKDSKSDPEAVASAARAVLRGIEGGAGRRHIRRPEELKRSYAAEIQSRHAVGNFWATGFGGMDARLVEGAMPKKTAVVAGLSGSGKSTFCGEFALRLAKQDRKVLYCAWEMGTESTLDIMVASMTRIPLIKIVQGSLDGAEVARVRRVTEWICDRITFMDNAFFGDDLRRGKRSNDKSLDILEGYLAEAGADAAIFDLWERCLVDLSYDGVTSALYRQQAMHAEYNVYGVIVQQLKLKDVEKRADKRPTREAIKGTGAFVEVADQIYGIHREAQFKDVPDDSLEVLCLKQRKGKAFWATRFDWNGEIGLVGGEGVDVPFDPSIETAPTFGDIDDVQTSKTKPKRSRREG